MSEYVPGDVVTVKPETTPYGGQLAVVVLVSKYVDHNLSLRFPLLPDAPPSAYSEDEVSPVLLDGAKLRVMGVPA